MTASVGTEVREPGIRQAISEIVRAVLGSDAFDPAVDLLDEGVTSLAFIRIIGQINARYEMTVDVMELEEASVDSLSALVTAQVNGKNRAERD